MTGDVDPVAGGRMTRMTWTPAAISELRAEELAELFANLTTDVERRQGQLAHPLLHAAASDLRDMLTANLDGMVPWTAYETLREEARAIPNYHLAWCCKALGLGSGSFKDRALALRAFTDELHARGQGLPEDGP